MNPIVALMLSHELEEDRRRTVAECRTRFLHPEAVFRPARRERTPTWTLVQRHPRFNTAL